MRKRARINLALCAALSASMCSAAWAMPATESLPLGPASGVVGPVAVDPVDAGTADADSDGTEPGGSVFEFGGYVRTVLSLGFVVGLALLAGAAVKKISKGGGGLLGPLGPGGPSPSGVLEILGRYPVGSGQTLVLLRLDRRLLLLHQTSGRRGSQMRTLSEITDADEVASVLLKTREARDESVQAGFREAMSRMETDFSAFETPPPDSPPDSMVDSSYRTTRSTEDGDRVELLGDGPVDRADDGDIVTMRARLRQFIDGARA